MRERADMEVRKEIDFNQVREKNRKNNNIYIFSMWNVLMGIVVISIGSGHDYGDLVLMG